ncbi:translation initiation factor eIF-2B subunit gamma [Anthonomus grandis grandis]|uniref:translation initiation factor eIF-2B subunit gamma n=1 Tax=Anthonomus grandis grandis TaxID=2921223 RepID=UPI002165A174|nr:translation initiation factor eIF-2B subunit gamma [Anthonomus grandis grandis]
MTIKPEFQAVVLAAGKGSRMLEVTSGQPKCLLPVGPKPLIWYTLNKLQGAGFTDAILIVLDNQKAEIQAALDKEIDNGSINLKIEFISILEDKEDLGTADSLRLKEVQERLKSDVLVLSCDLVTDVNLGGILNLFRKNNASVATLMFPNQTGNVVVPGPKSKHKPERDLIGIDQQTNRLVFLASASDFESDVALPMSLLKKHTHIKMYSNLIDSHIYVLKNWVIQFLKSQESFMSVKGELIPHIIKKQLSKVPAAEDTSASIVNTNDKNNIFNFAKEDQLDLDIREISSFNDHLGDLKGAYHDDPIRCYSCIAPKGSIGLRVNTLQAFWSINEKILDIWSKVSEGKELPRLSSKAEIKSNQVDERCIIWDGVKLNEKTSFKNSVIGFNSTVNSFSRVFNSIVMNNVVIKEKVALENCIICDSAVIETGTKLKNCIVGNSHLVPEESEHTNEVLTEVLMHF